MFYLLKQLGTRDHLPLRNLKTRDQVPRSLLFSYPAASRLSYEKSCPLLADPRPRNDFLTYHLVSRDRLPLFGNSPRDLLPLIKNPSLIKREKGRAQLLSQITARAELPQTGAKPRDLEPQDNVRSCPLKTKGTRDPLPQHNVICCPEKFPKFFKTKGQNLSYIKIMFNKYTNSLFSFFKEAYV